MKKSSRSNKLPLVLSLMILSSLVFAGVIEAEGRTARTPVVEQTREPKLIKEQQTVRVETKDSEVEDMKAEDSEVGKQESVREKKEIKSDFKETLKGDDSQKNIGKPDEKNATSREHMSEVAKQVNLLLQTKEDGDKGIGKEVRKIAQEQVQSQEKIAEKLAKMEAKKVWLKKMLGYDKEAVSSVQEEITANRLRIQELQKLQETTTDKTEVTTLENAANALIEQNASLDDTIQTEMKNQGVWGWFRNLMKTN